jgi:hypothetical protein
VDIGRCPLLVLLVPLVLLLSLPICLSPPTRPLACILGRTLPSDPFRRLPVTATHCHCHHAHGHCHRLPPTVSLGFEPFVRSWGPRWGRVPAPPNAARCKLVKVQTFFFFFCAKRYLAFGVSPGSDLRSTNAQLPTRSSLFTFSYILLHCYLLRILC